MRAAAPRCARAPRARRRPLHPELYGGGAPADGGRGDLDVGAPARSLLAGDDVDAPVAARSHDRTRAIRTTDAGSSDARASRSRTRNVPGPGASSAASSAATP